MKRSETIAKLASALVNFNSEVSKISKDSENPFFKNNYASLDNIVEEVRPILQKNKLSVMQFPSGDGVNVSITTMIMHESGEWIESEPLIMKPVKNDPQAIGSCITYARRYSLQAVLSLNTGEDDDGNNATHEKKPPQQKQNTNENKNSSPKLISEPQKKKLNILIGQISEKVNISREEVIATLPRKPGVGAFESISKMTIGQASKAINALELALGGSQ